MFVPTWMIVVSIIAILLLLIVLVRNALVFQELKKLLLELEKEGNELAREGAAMRADFLREEERMRRRQRLKGKKGPDMGTDVPPDPPIGEDRRMWDNGPPDGKERRRGHE